MAASTTSTINNGIQGLYSGSDGTVEYDWTAPNAGTVDSLGAIHITARVNGADAEADVQIGFVPAQNGLTLQSARVLSSSAAAVSYGLNFLWNSTPVSVTVQASMSGKTLNTDIQADHPVIADVYANFAPQTSHISPVTVPYYSGSIVLFPDWNVFANAYFDWQYTNGAEIDPLQSAYYQLTNGSRNTVKDRLVLSMSENIADVLPAITNPVSSYKSQLAGRMVIDIFDIWSFNQITEALTALGNAGVKNCVVLIHDWQKNGVDNALPDTYPPNAGLGGNALLSQAVAAGRNIGCYVAVHENYSDYYPNYSGFTYNAVALNSYGQYDPGWLNSTTQIQSYATKQTSVLGNAAAYSPQIHSGLNTNAGYVDVISAAEPWFHNDMDATQAGAGLISTVVNTNKNLWNYERQTYGGPVFGEGGKHWFWSGLLDGVEAQFGAGLNAKGEQDPLFVDFDLLKIHPLQVNHGMGLYDRWLLPGESITQTNLMDAYRMQEIIYGHAPYIGGALWSNIDRVLQEQNLVTPVAQRYGMQTPTLIAYQVNGAWTDSNAATKAGDWSRVGVQYDNGDVIVANAQSQTLSIGNYQIPQYGWAAQGNNLVAYTALRNGIIADYAQTATSFFANARNQADQFASGYVSQPSVQSFTQTGARSAQYQLQWKVLDGPQGASLTDFLHFTDSSGNVVFQSDYTLSSPTTQWRPGQQVVNTLNLVVPSNLPDGAYSMRTGLYSTQTGLRVANLGVDDGNRGYTLGNVIVSNNGQSVSFQPQALPTPPADLRLNTSGAVVDFSTIRTDGMVSLNLNQNTWTLQAYPRFRNVSVQLSTSQFPVPSRISCDSVAVSPLVANGYWQLPVNGAQSCSW